MEIGRPFGDNSSPDKTPGPNHKVKMLTGITLPNGETYSMLDPHGAPDYNSSGDASGLIRGLQLPTKGWLEWDWTDIRFPDRTSQIYVKNPIPPAPEPPEGSGMWPDIGNVRALSQGVTARRKLDENHNLIGTWQYTRLFSSRLLEPCTQTYIGIDPNTGTANVTRTSHYPAVMATVVSEPPDGTNTASPLTITYHSIYPVRSTNCNEGQNAHGSDKYEYGLPLNRYIGAAGRYLSVQNGYGTTSGIDVSTLFTGTGTPDNPNAFPGLLRSKYAAFDHADEFTGHFETSNRTYYAADGPQQYTESFNRLYDRARPKYVVSGGTIGGTAHYKTTLTNWAAISAGGALSPSVPWILTPYSEKCTVETLSAPNVDESTGLPSTCATLLTALTARATAPSAAMETDCFDASTGYLNGRRILENPATAGTHDVVTQFQQANGNTTEEAWFGADSSALPADLCTFSTAGGTYR
jgi:hypothetical protein